MSEVVVTRRGVHVRYRGVISEAGVEALIAKMRSHPDFDPSLPTVWDFSEADQSAGGLAADEMRRIGALAATFRASGGRPRIAVASPRAASFGGARMFAGVNEGKLPVDFRVFRDVAEALAWAFGPDIGTDE